MMLGGGALAVVVLAGIPGKLEWRNAPEAWAVRDGGTLTITSGKKTDWFIDPFDGRTVSNSPLLLFEPAQDFVLSAHVSVEHRSKWDAGALVVRVDDTTWAKLALELSPDGQPTFVTVVTRGLSDDSNSFSIAEHQAYLQIARAGQALVFYASTDGSTWKILRSFSLGAAKGLQAGFSAQSPAGEGCQATFSRIRYSAKRIANIYTGQ